MITAAGVPLPGAYRNPPGQGPGACRDTYRGCAKASRGISDGRCGDLGCVGHGARRVRGRTLTGHAGSHASWSRREPDQGCRALGCDPAVSGRGACRHSCQGHGCDSRFGGSEHLGSSGSTRECGNVRSSRSRCRLYRGGGGVPDARGDMAISGAKVGWAGWPDPDRLRGRRGICREVSVSGTSLGARPPGSGGCLATREALPRRVCGTVCGPLFSGGTMCSRHVPSW